MSIESILDYYEIENNAKESLGSETIYQPGIYTDGGTLGGNSTYITVTTTSNYLNNLRNRRWAWINIFNMHDDTDGASMVYNINPSAVLFGVYLRRHLSTNELYFRWYGGGVGFNSGYFTTIMNNLHVFSAIADVPNQNGWSYFDDSYSYYQNNVDTDLKAVDPSAIDIGQSMYISGDHSRCEHGGFFILDLSNVSTIDSVWAKGLHDKFYQLAQDYNYEPNRLRKVIYTYDNNIKGIYLKMEEAGSSGDFSNGVVKVYEIETGREKDGFSAVSSATGCSGVSL